MAKHQHITAKIRVPEYIYDCITIDIQFVCFKSGMHVLAIKVQHTCICISIRDMPPFLTSFFADRKRIVVCEYIEYVQ